MYRLISRSFIILAIIIMAGCDSDDIKELLGQEEDTETQAPLVILSEITPQNTAGGIGLVVSDVDNSEQIAFDIRSDNSNTQHIKDIYYTNDNNMNVSISINSANLPEKILYSNGTEIRLANHTPSTVDISFYDNGVYLEGPYTIEADLHDIIETANTISRNSSLMGGQLLTRDLNLQSTCSWFPNGGCANAYWWASKIFSVVGCGTAIAAATGTSVASAGTLAVLAVPAAVATCTSAVVSIGSDVLATKTEEKVFVATGWLSGGLETSANCIVGGLGSLVNAEACVRGIAEFSYGVYGEHYKNIGGNSSTTFDDACLTGTWSFPVSTCTQGEGSYDLPASEIYLSQEGTSVNMSGGAYNSPFLWDGVVLSRTTEDVQGSDGMECTSRTVETWNVSNCKTAQTTVNINIRCSSNDGLIPPADIRCSSVATKQ